MQMPCGRKKLDSFLQAGGRHFGKWWQGLGLLPQTVNTLLERELPSRSWGWGGQFIISLDECWLRLGNCQRPGEIKEGSEMEVSREIR